MAPGEKRHVCARGHLTLFLDTFAAATDSARTRRLLSPQILGKRLLVTIIGPLAYGANSSITSSRKRTE